MTHFGRKMRGRGGGGRVGREGFGSEPGFKAFQCLLVQSTSTAKLQTSVMFSERQHCAFQTPRTASLALALWSNTHAFYSSPWRLVCRFPKWDLYMLLYGGCICDRYVCVYMYMCVCRCTHVLEDRGQQQASPSVSLHLFLRDRLSHRTQSSPTHPEWQVRELYEFTSLCSHSF